jgi:pyridoxamine 5'-phosphate oxidase
MAAPSGLRQEYDREVLLEAEAERDPFVQLGRWFEEAAAGEIYEPNAMALATVAADGRPSLRMVLLKGMDERGLSFFTNLESRKAGEIAANPNAALLFWWDRLHRQVRVEGAIEPVGPDEAEAYFATRPYGSRIGAWASPQSRVIEGRNWLEAREAALRERYPEDGAVPRPAHWGGFRLVPETYEFWQGRRSRLHDRLCYWRQESSWVMERLAP